ncbi:Tol-Pal system beta propeller repeat protein TolB [Tepidimonas taiwanensis]|uniref:Tol-Pal system beta propeller repeat protein TolB n=1 Tax=Tepidimonas taiwanensis TaxID=307486 RepID=UPI0009EAE8E3|nr:Tol-Pal system beta propeller repeat protein TolB [Tepidimonas taiwanensis]
MDDRHHPPSSSQRAARPGRQDARPGVGVSRRRWLQGVGGVALAGGAAPGLAQFRVEVTGVGVPQIPFAIAPWRVAPGVPQDVAAIVAADLVRSGQLRQLPGGAAVLDEMSRPDLAPWRAQGADALITGSVNRLADGRFDVRFRLWDAVRGTDLGGQSYPVSAADLRLAAHRIADYVYEKLTGERGVFATRIAYVSKNGDRYQLWVADADGENAQPALTSREPIISPAWSPNGAQLAYVSFESLKPVIYAHDIATGRRRLLASFRGSNSAPAWSPDGKRLYATLTLAGSSQIYALDLDGGAPQRITQTGGIDTEPAFAPDGKAVYFVSDRGGSPQIYRMRPDGGEVTRVTFDGSYNISPAVSPDGRHLAFVSRIGDGYRLRLMDLGTGAVTSLTDTAADESPSFAPNGRLIVYATRVQGRESLMTTTLDGRIKTRLSAAGSVREPDWGPFLT